MSEVELRGVKKLYGAVEAIKMLDLGVEKGEFCALLGPSGCGKSTLLRMIAGLEVVTQGSIWIGDTDVTNVPPAKRRIAMVFQSYALYPHMTVRQNIGFSLRVAKAPKEVMDRRTQEVARMLQLEELLDRRPAQLSGGQRQRVAIGRALVREPQVFLFDEPLSNLDAMLRVQMRVEIAKLHQDLKTTMIYVTHDQVEAMTLADKIVVLEAGEIRQIGTPHGALPRAGQQVRRRLHRLADDELRLRRGALGRGAGRRARPARRRRDEAEDARHARQPVARTRWNSASGRSTSSSPRRTIRAPISAARCRSSSIWAIRRSCMSTPRPGSSSCRTTAKRSIADRRECRRDLRFRPTPTSSPPTSRRCRGRGRLGSARRDFRQNPFDPSSPLRGSEGSRIFGRRSKRAERTMQRNDWHGVYSAITTKLDGDESVDLAAVSGRRRLPARRPRARYRLLRVAGRSLDADARTRSSPSPPRQEKPAAGGRR